MKCIINEYVHWGCIFIFIFYFFTESNHSFPLINGNIPRHCTVAYLSYTVL